MIIPPAHRLSGVGTYYFARKLAEIDEMNLTGEKVINLGIGSPDLRPPDGVLETLNATSAQPGANMYQSYRGTQELREAFANWYLRHFKINLDPGSEVLPLLGSKEGIMHISATFLNEGDEVLVPDPGYLAYGAAAKLMGARVTKYCLTHDKNWLPDLDELASRNLDKCKLMWINYPHMPTGAQLDATTLQKLVDFARANNILLCSDNPYALILSNDARSIFSAEGAKEVCLELNSLSKHFNMAGWRVGAVLGAKIYLDEILRFKSNMDSGMYLPVQKAASKALGVGDIWYENLNKTYEQRRKEVRKLMTRIGCAFDDDQAGLFVWGRINEEGITSEEFSQRILQQARVFVTPGHIFGEGGEGYVRISLCAPADTITEAFNRVEEAAFTIKHSLNS